MKTLLNDQWEFLKLPLESTLEQAIESNGWTKVDLPHDWLIWQPGDLYESADAWYRRELWVDVPAENTFLYFDGVYMDCDVLLNGRIITSHAYGYTAFRANFSGELVPGRNEVMVHIRHKSPNSRWYSGSGIFRDVFLEELPKNHIVPDSFYFSEKEIPEGWKFDIQAEAHGTDHVLFSFSVLDAGGNRIASGQAESSRGIVHAQTVLHDVSVWDPDNPVLYRLRYTFGEDSGELCFGLRTVEFSPENGLILNHRKLKLKGVCLHHDLGALGAAFHEKAAKRQLKLMKEMGANALRTSHNPPASRLLDLCDEMGILVVDEAFDMWERPKTEYDYARFFPSCEEEDVARWIRRDRCHPSVILWSIGNEIYDMHADQRGTEVCAMLMNQVYSHDPNRHASVTFGCNYMPWEGGQRCADLVKIAGYNYGEKYYDAHHRKYPDWVIYGSETASVLSSRGIYHFPASKSIMSEADLQCSALGNSNTSWGASDLKEIIVDDLRCPYSMGQFIWSGIDYIGEPTPYHTRSCYFGQADTACFPKDSYYLFQSLWSSRPVLHIGVYWDWNPGQLIDVPVMTNFRRVELLLNGKSLGIMEICADDSEKCAALWKVPYEPGILCARALDDQGNTLLESFRKTSGDTEKLLISSENDFLQSDGNDIAFLMVQAADRNGNPVENARDRVHICVSGGAVLIGTDNGDSTDPDGYKQNNRRLFNGKLLLIVASNGLREDAVIRVESTAGSVSEYRLPVLKAEPVPGVSRIQQIPDTEADHLIPVRKIEICSVDGTHLTKEKPECTFRWKQLPEGSKGEPVRWQVTNESGILSPFVAAVADGDRVTVRAAGDGKLYLRALGGNNPGHPEIISQIELTVEGIGNPALDPYSFISAGLYDLHEGDIGTGNEKGVAFARDGESMVGFSRVDFGKTGSDVLILPVFALDGKPYEIELLDRDKDGYMRLITVLHYEKPSIWNQYQEERYQLPERLKGIHGLCFRMKEKVHLKGFSFERRSRAFDLLYAGEADSIYGDSFILQDNEVRRIGNNVSLCFEDMDFGNLQECSLTLFGRTDLPVNTVTVRIQNADGIETAAAVDFSGSRDAQSFSLKVPGGNCNVTFVFLPGSSFDFKAFRFEKTSRNSVRSVEKQPAKHQNGFT